MIVTGAAGGAKRGLGKMTILDPTKSGATSTNVNQVGAMFDTNGKPIDSNTTKKWVRPTQTVQTGGAVGGEVTSQAAGGMITPEQMLNNIKSDLNKKEANMAGLNSVTGGFNTTRGLGLNGNGTGVSTPMVGNAVVGQPVISRPGVVGGQAVQPVQNGAAQTTPTNTIIKPGTKVVVAGGAPVGGAPIQNGVIQNTGVVGAAATADQRIANAKRNAGKLLNKLMEMAYNLTEQEEKYLLEMLDAIGMKETFLSAAGLGTATPINAQVVLNAINEMNQIMTANANITSYNIELANSIYSKLDTLTLEAQAGGYNEAELITVLAELYASGMINIQDTSKPNVVFCFNTLKGQIERMMGGVQPNGVINNTVARPVVTNPVNTQIRTNTVGIQANGVQPQQAGGKMFTRPVNQIQNRFNMSTGVGTTGGSGLNFNRGLNVGTTEFNSNIMVGGSGLNFNRGASMITTPMGANNLRTNIGVQGSNPMMGANMTGGVAARVNIGANQGGYFNAANQDVNYSNRGVGQVGASGGFMGATLRGAGMGVQNNMMGGVVTRPNMVAPMQGGVAAGYNSVNMMQGSGLAPTSPIMQYMAM